MQVFAIGLEAGWHDAIYLFRRPRLLAKSFLAMNVAVPITAILLIKTFPFPVAVAITLGVLAVTPVPPLLPRSLIKAWARSSYVLGLVESQALLAIVLVPVTIELMDWALGARAHFDAARVATMIAETILLPLATGMLASRFIPRLKRFVATLLMVGTVLLIAGAIPLVFLGWKALGALAGNGAILAIAIFVVAGMAAGRFLGGKEPADRMALAVATPARHPGLAVAIARASFPEESRLVAGAIVIYLVLRMLLSFLYIHRQHPPEKRLKEIGGPHQR
jgi:BASS family bile acid:Na+ symporter